MTDNNKTLSVINSGGAVVYECETTSLDPDGFTISWTTNNASSDEIFYAAYGGDELTNSKVGTFNHSTADGNQDVTGVGFQPDVVFFMGTNHNILNSSQDMAQHIFGVGKSSTQQWCINNSSRNGTGAADNSTTQLTDRIYYSVGSGNVSQTYSAATYVSSLPDDGFRINWVNTAGTTVVPIFYLAIKGGSWAAGAFNQPGLTGNQAITGIGGFQPRGTIFLSNGRAAASSSTLADIRLSFGAATAASSSTTTSQSVISVSETNATDPTVSARGAVADNTGCIRNITANATGANSSIDSEAAFVSNDTDGFTVNWTTIASTTARQILYVSTGGSQATTTVSATLISRYHNAGLLTKPAFIFPYHSGGRVVPDALHTHRFNILGVIKKTLDSLYRNYISVSPAITLTARYEVALAVDVVNVTRSFLYHITRYVVGIASTFRYDVDPAAIHLTGFGKPLRPRLVVFAHNDWNTQLIRYNSFRPDDSHVTTSGLKILEIDVRLAEDSAGDFSILIEDHAKQLDPTIIGEGNAVLIQAAKLEEQLWDGDHILMFGYVRSRSVIRQDTGTLEYRLQGHGAAVSFNERITSFSYSAKRTSITDPTPDPTDSNMFAANLVQRLVRGTDHLPLGAPLLPFSIYGVTDREPRVDDFVPVIDKPMTEFSTVMNELANTNSAVWGVRPIIAPGTTPSATSMRFNVDTYFHYPTLEHSGIIIKDSVDEIIDDLKKTAMLVGPWSYTDSISKDDGFTNRFFAKSGTKNSTGNVINITSITDKYTELFSDTTPGPDVPGGTGIGGTNVDIVRFPNQATAGVIIRSGWNGTLDLNEPPVTSEERDDGYRTLANIQRQRPTVKVIATIFHSDIDTMTQAHTAVLNRVRILQDGGVTVLADINADSAIPEATVKAQIDKYQQFYNVDGVYFFNVNNVDENQYKSYYTGLADYCKINKGMKLVCFETFFTPIDNSWFADLTNVDIYRVGQFNTTLPPLASWSQGARDVYPNYPVRKRYMKAFNISQATGFTDEMIKTWIRDMVEGGMGSYFHISDEATLALSNDELMSHINLVMNELENLQKEQPGQPGPPLPIPNPRDLCQSFTVKNANLSDLMLVLSRVGNPQYKAGNAESHGKNQPDMPNAVHGHIEGSKVISFTETDPATGTQVTRVTEMPNGEVLGYFDIPFDQISLERPTPVFLNNVVYRKKQIIPDRRYWVVLYGRGQSESSTIRWHHSDSPQQDSLSGQRIPGGHDVFQQWTVFEQSQNPGFALRFFDTTLQFIEASDSDSIERFGLVESTIDLSYIPDESLAAKFLHAVLNQSSRPKRIYDVNQVTATDDLILPGKLVSIIDEMSSHPAIGSDVVDAEIVEVGYLFSAKQEPLGCRYISIKPVGYVDFAFTLWKRKLDLGQIVIPIGEDIVVTPNPPPPPEPEPTPTPEEPTTPTEPTPTPEPEPEPTPTPPPPPPDLDTSGIKRQIRCTTVTQFLNACNAAVAGDEIVMVNGSYSVSSSSDTTFTSRAGTAANPIIVRAENVGGVTLTGSARFTFSGCTYVTWYGFVHRHDASGTGSGSTGFAFSGGHHNRFARCDVDLNDTATRTHWVYMSNTHFFRVDHNDFHHKAEDGGFIQVSFDSDVPAGEESIIEYNMIRNHTTPDGDSGEALIMGASQICRNDFRVTVRYNFFQSNTGDPEIITNKACRCLYFNNSFVNNTQCQLVLRHGDHNAVIGNYFEGINGIRILGEGNLIANNHITNYGSGSSTGRRPIVLENGDADRPTSQGANYERVVNNTIIYNTVENGTASVQELVLWGRSSRTYKPTGVTFRGNILKCANGRIFTFDNSATASGNTISTNIAHATGSASYGDMTTGMATRVDPGLTRGTDGIYRIAGTGSTAYGFVSTSTNTFSASTTIDIDGESRTGRSDAGCDHYSTALAKPKKRIVASDTGPSATTFLGDSPVWNP